MYGRSWFYSVAIGGWLVVAVLLCPLALQAQDAPEEQSRSAATADKDAGNGKGDATPQQDVPIEVPLPTNIAGTGGTDAGSAEDRAEDAREKEEHDAADLKAQQDMADWALGTLFATWASVGVALAAVILVYITLRDTRRSDERQLRAYVALMPGPVSFGRNGFRVQIIQSNKGQTQAKNVIFSCTFGVFTYPLPDDAEFPTPEFGPETKVIAPTQEFFVRRAWNEITTFIGTTTESLNIIDNWHAANQHLYVKADITYKDIFGKPQTTVSCWSYSPTEIRRVFVRFSQAHPGVSAMDVPFHYATRYNDAS